jgi:hypothetical protein
MAHPLARRPGCSRRIICPWRKLLTAACCGEAQQFDAERFPRLTPDQDRHDRQRQ